MQKLDQLIASLPGRHQEALRWFVAHAGVQVAWPSPVRFDGKVTHLTTKAKGIYKPEWSKYALSVRQGLRSRYPDREPVVRNDGTWVYPYYQENDDPDARDTEYTNVAMMECLRDRVPVGVMRQMKSKPGVRYLVLGVALVSSWDGGYFFLEGFSSTGQAAEASLSSELDFFARNAEAEQGRAGDFDPASVVDGRERVVAQIVRRRGQPEFRAKLLFAYEGRCAITGCDAADALEAAHILPYQGDSTHHVGNGILLRADVHTLFDLGLVAIDSASMSVRVSPKLLNSVYGALSGMGVDLPTDPLQRPSVQALDLHRAWSKL